MTHAKARSRRVGSLSVVTRQLATTPAAGGHVTVPGCVQAGPRGVVRCDAGRGPASPDAESALSTVRITSECWAAVSRTPCSPRPSSSSSSHRRRNLTSSSMRTGLPSISTRTGLVIAKATGRALWDADCLRPSPAGRSTYESAVPAVSYSDGEGPGKSREGVSEHRVAAREALPDITVVQVASGLRHPLDLIVVPDGAIVFMQRGGGLIRHVEEAADRDITRGCAANPPSCCPYESVTRAQTASFLTRALRLPGAHAPAGFTDTEGSVHATAIDALAAAGGTTGCATDPGAVLPRRVSHQSPDGYLSPPGPVTPEATCLETWRRSRHYRAGEFTLVVGKAPNSESG